jgi:putative ABC transport system permease protein
MAVQLSLAWFAWKNLGRRRLRTVLTLGGIAMAIGAFVALVGFSNSFEHEWLRIYESGGTDIAVVQKTFLNTSVDDSGAAKLATLPTVARVTPMIFNMMDLTPEINALVYGWKADSFEFDALTMKSGRRFRDGQPELILGDLLASNLNKTVGDTLSIEGSSFTITGIFHGGSALETGAAILPLDQLQQISSLQGKASAFHVRLHPTPTGQSPEHYLQTAQAQIEAALPGLRAVPAAERASSNQLVVMAHAVAWGTSSIALLMGILGIANTMAMSVFERTREIGILRALGWKRWRILLLIEFEATALAFIGGIFGIALGWSALHILSTLPQTATIVSADFPPMLFLESLGVAIFVGLAAGAIPACRGARLSPVEALRHD